MKGGQGLEQRPKETVDSVPEVSKILTGQGLNSLLYRTCFKEGMGLETSRDPFQPNDSPCLALLNGASCKIHLPLQWVYFCQHLSL